MSRPHSFLRPVALLLLAVAVWFALGFSLGWYYTFTYYGKTGLPKPMIEPCVALILYYFSVLNIATEGQAVHWMLVFPVAGLMWTTTLRFIAQRSSAGPTPSFGVCAAAIAITSLPLAIPGPWMAVIAAQTPDGLSWEMMIRVALRRANITPWEWLSPLYFALGLTGLALQVWVYQKLFPFRGARAARHAAVSAIITVLAAIVIAAAAAIPLRQLLE